MEMGDYPVIISQLRENTIGTLPFAFADNTVTLSLPEGVIIIISEGVMVITPSTLYFYREQYCYLISSLGSTIEEGARYISVIPELTITSGAVIYRTYLIRRQAGEVTVSDLDHTFSYTVQSHYRRLTIISPFPGEVSITEDNGMIQLRVRRPLLKGEIFDFSLLTRGNSPMKIICNGRIYRGVPPRYDHVVGRTGQLIPASPSTIIDMLLYERQGIHALMELYG